MNQKSVEYLEKYFVDENRLAELAGVSIAFLRDAVEAKAIPGPSYIVKSRSIIESHIFGPTEAIEEEKKYFHRSTLSWVKNLENLLKEGSLDDAAEKVRVNLQEDYKEFLKENTNKSSEEIDAAWENTWTHFLKGTYGVCVINPIDGKNIAKKQNAAANLREFTENGQRSIQNQEEWQKYLYLVEQYNLHTMPFAPWDHYLSSRNLLVDDFKSRVGSHIQNN